MEDQLCEEVVKQLSFNIQTNKQLKSSFDRFGDDLTELILSYLSFENKLRFECVSKQWRRLVFNKQFVLEIKIYYEYNGRVVIRETFLKIYFIQEKFYSES